MTDDQGQLAAPPGFLRTVGLLLATARKRAAGRQKRQQELLYQRARKNAVSWAWLGTVMAVVLTVAVNIGAAVVVQSAVEAGQRFEAERQGKIVVSEWFIEMAKVAEEQASPKGDPLEDSYARAAHQAVGEYGAAERAMEARLRQSVRSHGVRDLVAERVAVRGLGALPGASSLSAFLGSAVLLCWGVMLVFQGEGLELDLQRRRHPMWEWLFSHPVRPGAVFAAEMLSPIAANPSYCTAPLFAGILYGLTYGSESCIAIGFAAAFLIGIPVAVAAACLGKALEIGVILRFPPRSRGALIGLMSWLGYASMMLFLLGLMSFQNLPAVFGAVLKPLASFAAAPWPWLGLFLGRWNGSFSFVAGMLACWLASGVTIAAAVGFSVWGAQQGLGGNGGRADAAPAPGPGATTAFGREPLYRKELLWFIRDRSAIVQTILIPLTVAGVQLFNMRAFLAHAQDAWNYLCGAAILFGTYFLWVLGPKSLASEGTALWIALTWPRGLESLLKAKAWLWSLISTGIVLLVLGYAAWIFPHDAWKILLVGIGWFFFARSMAEKTVTLVQVPSSSGEAEKIPRTRQWAASLGMLTFSIGILTQQWHLAIMGIVYSAITAAAMWENFRARLPFLYDPWSEQLPPPPTLMHAMVAISVLVEGGAVLSGIAVIFVGAKNIAMAQVIGTGLCAIVVSAGLAKFLRDRDVFLKDVCCWPDRGNAVGFWERCWCGDGTRSGRFARSLALGAAGGLALGVLGLGYVFVLGRIPALAEFLRHSREMMDQFVGMRTAYTILAVTCAPFTEEYLFRGLLFRALDREWGGWKAVVGSAAFFAIYHPPLAWLPVGCLGIANALLFKKTGRLAPAVLLHMAYNSVVCAGS